jgi:hypothetical protein
MGSLSVTSYDSQGYGRGILTLLYTTQDIVLGLLLYLLYTADLPISPQSTTATFADDTAIVAMDNDTVISSHKLQTNLLAIQN